MTDEQVLEMKKMLKEGKLLAWWNGGTMRQILSISMRDGEIAGNFDHGDYIALDNTDPDEIVIFNYAFPFEG